MSEPATASTVAAPSNLPDVPDQLKSAFANLLTQGSNAVHDSAVWVQGQLPDLVKQFIMLNAARDIYWIIFGLVVALIGWGASRKMFKAAEACTYSSDKSGFTCGGVFIAGCAYLVAGIVVATNIFDLISLLVAPKIYIIEYLINLAKTKG